MEALHTDCQKHPERWEHTTLADFLEALGRYAEDIQQYYINTRQAADADCPGWQVFADMLLGAREYE